MRAVAGSSCNSGCIIARAGYTIDSVRDSGRPERRDQQPAEVGST
jgi:hypothetical protein